MMKKAMENKREFHWACAVRKLPSGNVNLHILVTFPSAGIEIPVKGCQKQWNIK